MKTTLYLPDSLYRGLKVTAASEGRTLTELIEDCLRRGFSLMRRPAERKKSVYRLPVVRSKKPGMLNLTSKMIEDAMFDIPAKMSRK